MLEWQLLQTSKTEIKLLLVLLQCPCNVAMLPLQLYISVMITHAIVASIPSVLLLSLLMSLQLTWAVTNKANKTKTIATAISTLIMLMLLLKILYLLIIMDQSSDTLQRKLHKKSPIYNSREYFRGENVSTDAVTFWWCLWAFYAAKNLKTL